MRSKEAKNKIIELHNKGLDIHEIVQCTNYNLSLVKVHINQYKKRNIEKEGFFNIDKLECWIFPSSKVN